MPKIPFTPAKPGQIFVEKEGKLYTEEELEKEVQARVEQELKENYNVVEWKIAERNEITVLRIGAMIIACLLLFIILTKRRN